nr:site-specific integrase [uncultured Agathobaculum sp.]
MNSLEDYQIAAFMKAVHGHPLEAVYIVDLFTGMRQGEILGLAWDCIDFDKGIITIYRQLQLIKGEYKFASLKNDKPRQITPVPYVMQVLSRHHKRQLQARLQVGEAWENEKDFVFTDSLGRHLARQTVYQHFQHFKRFAAQIGMPDACFHDLSHSYAVAALQSGGNVKTIQQNRGHHTAAFTLDVYGHVSESMQRESAERMEAFINAVSNL